MKQSQWMKGLLWAESNFKNNPDLDVSKIVRKYLYEQCDPFEDKYFIEGAEDHLKHYEER